MAKKAETPEPTLIERMRAKTQPDRSDDPDFVPKEPCAGCPDLVAFGPSDPSTEPPGP